VHLGNQKELTHELIEGAAQCQWTASERLRDASSNEAAIPM